MSAQSKEIVSMFEVCGMTPEQISDEVGIELAVVKCCLKANSSAYNETVLPEHDITDAEFEQIKMGYKQLMFSEDEKVRERALRFLWNEKKGRNEDKTMIANIGKMNIIMFNERLNKARQARERFLSKNNSEPAIDVPSEKEIVAA